MQTLWGLLIGLWLLLLVWHLYWRRQLRTQHKNSSLLRLNHQRELEANLHAIIDELSQFCKAHPALTQPYLMLGNLYRLCGEAQRGLIIHQNLTTDSKLSKIMQDRLQIEIANDLIVLGHEENAFAPLQNISDRSPHFINAQEKLVELHYKRQDYLAAYECMKTILQKKHNWRNQKRTAYFAALAANRFYHEGDLPAAESYAEKALSSDNQCLLAIYLRGEILLKRHEYDAAVDKFSEMLKINQDFAFLAIPKIEDAFYGKQSFMRLGEKLLELVQLYPHNPFLTFSLGKYWRKKKMYADARRSLVSTLEINPTYLPARQELVYLNSEENHPQATTTEYQELLDEIAAKPGFICSNCQSRYVQLAWHCTACGRWESIQANHYLFPHVIDEDNAPIQHQASHS